jgi:pyruvate dehydrogenase E2 component (dihydrolipoamide acetyltransferase)/2-oxoglutarate dehydrogenase E2 component (dihydrolipoamide succinyltransferase)
MVTVVEWKVKGGDKAEKGDIILSVESEKATCDIEAEASGFIHIIVADGKIMVGKTAGLIAETKEELEELQKKPAWELAQE